MQAESLMADEEKGEDLFSWNEDIDVCNTDRAPPFPCTT
jgi:hypothetical protein